MYVISVYIKEQVYFLFFLQNCFFFFVFCLFFLFCFLGGGGGGVEVKKFIPMRTLNIVGYSSNAEVFWMVHSCHLTLTAILT